MDNIEQKLGFDRIRQMVVEQCTNALATRMAEDMRFSSDFEKVQYELQLTEEMLKQLGTLRRVANFIAEVVTPIKEE